MPLSFGISAKVIERPEYNLGVALPLICAFYIANENPLAAFLTSWLGNNSDVINAVTIILVGSYYYFFLLFAALASHFSAFIEDQRTWLAVPIIVLLISVYSIFTGDVTPKVSLYFTVLSVLVLTATAFRKHTENFSRAAASFLGGAVSLICVSTGILWFFGKPIMKDTVASAFGIKLVASDSIPIGGFMLIAIGYVIFYGVFKINECDRT